MADHIQELAGADLLARVADVAISSLGGGLLAPYIREGSATKRIKQVFGDLGKDLGFVIAASGYARADDGEWLYDMCWFVSKPETGMFFRQPLILESELKPGGSVKHSASIDGDFHKLVQARAEIRVWLAAVPNALLAQKHIANCKQQAREFGEAREGDSYIFVLYVWEDGKSIIEKFQVGNE